MELQRIITLIGYWEDVQVMLYVAIDIVFIVLLFVL